MVVCGKASDSGRGIGRCARESDGERASDRGTVIKVMCTCVYLLKDVVGKIEDLERSEQSDHLRKPREPVNQHILVAA